MIAAWTVRVKSPGGRLYLTKVYAVSEAVALVDAVTTKEPGTVAVAAWESHPTTACAGRGVGVEPLEAKEDAALDDPGVLTAELFDLFTT